MIRIPTLGTLAVITATAIVATAHPDLSKRDCSFTWAAEAGDTCTTMATTWGISVDQFTRWNSNPKCDALVVGKEYCLLWSGANEPGLSAVTPTSTTTKPATTSTTTKPTTTTKPAGPSPTQDGIVSTCVKYHLATTSDTCADLVTKYGSVFTLDQFYAWNPAVGASCQSLWLGYYYCVGIPSTPSPKPSTTTTTSSTRPTQTGIASGCQRYHRVASGDTCQVIVDKYKTFTLAQFYAWNPAVGKACETLWMGYDVCIEVKGAAAATTTKPAVPVQSGVASKCNKWHLVASGDICQTIADKYKVSLANFYKWNPAVGSNCAYLWLGYNVCVGSS